MKAQSLVSVIIPTYNRAYILEDTLDSIVDQTYSNWECIIIDDGSTDNTEKLIHSYSKKDSRIVYYRRPKSRPKGANACRNYGFEMSRGEYINWFDSDDLMHPEKLEKQLKILEEKKLSFCVCQTQIFDGNIENNLGLRHPKLKSEKFWEDYLMYKISWLTQAPLWKRSFLKGLRSLFDESLQAAQEWEFHLRALDKVDDYVITNMPLVFLRDHEHSISKGNQEKVLWNYFLARFKVYNYFQYKISPEASDFLQQYFLNSFKNALRNGQKKLAWKIWRTYILDTTNLSAKSKFKLSLGFFSYLVTNRGDVFIAYINK